MYSYGLPVEVKSGNTVIDYTYDHSRRKTSVTINNKKYASFSYKDYTYNTNQNKCTFTEQTTILCDGTVILQSKTGVMDSVSGRIKTTETTKINGNEQAKKQYDENGLLSSVVDSFSGTTMYNYDDYDNLIKVTAKNVEENYTYNEYGELTSKILSGAVEQTYTYAYKNNVARDLEYVGFDNYKFYPLSDVNGRNTGKEIYNGTDKIVAEYITYRKVGDHATNMPATVWFGGGNAIKDSVKYKYDSCGNISQITENGHLTARYEYDSLNRLIREDNTMGGQ